MAIALLLWAPTTISHGTPIVTGHSTFYDGDGFSPCLGSIAGIMRHRVMWFNDQVLVETYGGAGTFIWATEFGAPDPRKQDKLYSEGVFYDFVDPNGAHWHVEELFFDVGQQADLGAVGFDDDGNLNVTGPTLYNGKRTMVWVVELAPKPIFDEFAGADAHTYYNFLMLVDTCKLHSNTVNSYAGIADHNNESGLLNDKYGHENGEQEHTHEVYQMELYIGKRPTAVIPYGVQPDGAEWTTNWAYQESAGQANQMSGGTTGDVTGETYGDLAP